MKKLIEISYNTHPRTDGFIECYTEKGTAFKGKSSVFYEFFGVNPEYSIQIGNLKEKITYITVDKKLPDVYDYILYSPLKDIVTEPKFFNELTKELRFGYYKDDYLNKALNKLEPILKCFKLYHKLTFEKMPTANTVITQQNIEKILLENNNSTVKINLEITKNLLKKSYLSVFSNELQALMLLTYKKYNDIKDEILDLPF